MKTIDELRSMAEEVLSQHPRSLNSDEWGGNFKKLLEELSIYQIELEHQNKALSWSERELAAAHEEYVKLFESTPVGYVILNETRHIIRVNQTFINYFVSVSMKNSQLEGKCFDSYVVDEFKNAFSLFCKMALKQRIPVPVELKLLDRHNTPHYVLLTAQIYDPAKRWIALTASDISMQKRMEEQLARAKDEAEEADRKKSRFLTNVSHELRTPLSTIIGYGVLMEDRQISDAEKMDFFKNIVTTSKLLLRFSDDVLDVSTLESGETPLRNQVVNMVRICSETAHLLSRKVVGKNVLLTVRAENVPLLWTDQLRLSQIIHAVLEHATENIVEGEIVLTCSYESENDKYGHLILKFTGREIFSSENDFERDIRRVPLSRSYASLGLFLTQRIVKAMKGEMIWEHPLDSLRIEIPVEISPFREEHNDEPPGDIPQMPDEIRKCLLVDDVAMNLKVLGMMMKKFGYTPVLAMSGEEALELVKKDRFSLIMTDLWMPKMSGEELAMMLRQNPDLDDVPIFAVTADIENDSNFNMEFFNATIIKPVNRDKLQKILEPLNKAAAMEKK